MQIEVEVRSFISEEEHERLLSVMEREAEFLGKDKQTTYYLSGKQDLRIQKGSSHAKVWMKGGKIHDRYRQEVEVRFKREDFDKMVEIFGVLGHEVCVKWFRNRKMFNWDGVLVMLDHSRGYGRIIELEKMAQHKDKEKTYGMLKSKLESLGVDITPRSEFEKRFKDYVENWKKLTKGQR